MFKSRLRALSVTAAVGAAAVLGGTIPALAAPSAGPATGYDVLTSNGGVHNFGLPWYGSPAGKLGKLTAVGIAVDQQTGGYWVLKSNGGVAAFNAPWKGSMGADKGFPPATAITPSGNGYDILTANGGVHNFGAPWYGSLAGTLGNLRAVGIASDPSTGGYWILKSNGGVADFNAPFVGSVTFLGLTATAISGM